MTSYIQLDFSGKVDRGLFEAALDAALDRHPLLAATVRLAKGGRLCWVPMSSQLPPIDGNVMEEPIRKWVHCPIDLTGQCGIRIWVRTSDRATHLTLQVHHACTDGTGVYRFLGDVLAIYGMACCSGSNKPRLSAVEPGLLRFRRRKMAAVAMEGRALRFVWQGLREAWKVFGTRIAAIAAPRDLDLQVQGGDSSLRIHTMEFTHEEHQQLRQRAAMQGAMVNDLLLSEMFRAVARWNRQQLRGRDSDRLRIMMPFDLRDQHDYEMPAANMTAYTFLTRRVGDCQSPDRLLADIRDATARIKQGRAGTEFIDALILAEYAPPVLPFLLRLNRCLATVTLSNVGDPTERFTASFPKDQGRIVCGNVILEAVRGVPPLRQKMNTTVATFSYLRKLTICMRCNPHLFGDAATQSLLRLYADGLREQGNASGVNADSKARKSA